MTRKPILLGHRGCRTPDFTENSIAAFAYALSQGCDGFEFDLRCTRDGQIVVWHDPQWNGLTIGKTNFQDLTDAAGERLARFEDVLRQFGQTAYLDIELKVAGIEASVVAALRESPPRAFMVSSFHPAILWGLRHIEIHLPMGFICERSYALGIWRTLPVQAVLPRYDLVTPKLVTEVHQRDLEIMTWTVNDPERMRQLADWGIDGIISDDPALLYQTFHSG